MTTYHSIATFAWTVEITLGTVTRYFSETDVGSPFVAALPPSPVALDHGEIPWQHRRMGNFPAPTATVALLMGTRDAPLARHIVADERIEGARMVVRKIPEGLSALAVAGTGAVAFDGVIERIEYVAGAARLTAVDRAYHLLRAQWPPNVATVADFPRCPSGNIGSVCQRFVGSLPYVPCLCLQANAEARLSADIAADAVSITLSRYDAIPGTAAFGAAQADYGVTDAMIRLTGATHADWSQVGYARVASTGEIIRFFAVSDMGAGIVELKYCARGEFGTVPTAISAGDSLQQLYLGQIGDELLLYMAVTAGGTVYVYRRGVQSEPYEGVPHYQGEIFLAFIFTDHKWLVADHAVASLANALIWDGSRFRRKAATDAGADRGYVLNEDDTGFSEDGRHTASVTDVYASVEGRDIEVTAAEEFWWFGVDRTGNAVATWREDDANAYDLVIMANEHDLVESEVTYQKTEHFVDSTGDLFLQIAHLADESFATKSMIVLSDHPLNMRDAEDGDIVGGVISLTDPTDVIAQIRTAVNAGRGRKLAKIQYSTTNHSREMTWGFGASVADHAIPDNWISHGEQLFMYADLTGGAIGDAAAADDTWLSTQKTYLLGEFLGYQGDLALTEIPEFRYSIAWGEVHWSDLDRLIDGNDATHATFTGQDGPGATRIDSLLRFRTPVPDMDDSVITLQLKIGVEFGVGRLHRVTLGRTFRVRFEEIDYAFNSETDITAEFADHSNPQDVVVELNETLYGQIMAIDRTLILDDAENFWYLKIEAKSGEDMTLRYLKIGYETGNRSDLNLDPFGGTVLAVTATGAADNADGAFTGTPGLEITRPSSAAHWIMDALGVTSDMLDLPGLAVARLDDAYVTSVAGIWLNQEPAMQAVIRLLYQSGLFLCPPLRGGGYRIARWPDSDAESVGTFGPWDDLDSSLVVSKTSSDDIINNLRIFYDTNYLTSFTMSYAPHRLSNTGGQRRRLVGIGLPDWLRETALRVTFRGLHESALDAFAESAARHGDRPFEIHADFLPTLAQAEKLALAVADKDARVRHIVTRGVPNRADMSLDYLDVVTVCSESLPEIPGGIVYHGRPWKYATGRSDESARWPGVKIVIIGIRELDKARVEITGVEL